MFDFDIEESIFKSKKDLDESLNQFNKNMQIQKNRARKIGIKEFDIKNNMNDMGKGDVIF